MFRNAQNDSVIMRGFALANLERKLLPYEVITYGPELSGGRNGIAITQLAGIGFVQIDRPLGVLCDQSIPIVSAAELASVPRQYTLHNFVLFGSAKARIATAQPFLRAGSYFKQGPFGRILLALPGEAALGTVITNGDADELIEVFVDPKRALY